MAVWAPIRSQDNRAAAEKATQYLTGTNVRHFWDTWRFSLDWYTRQLKYPPNREAWDIYVLYRPGQRWETRLPQPAVWMQNHNLDFGLKYDPRRLEEALKQVAGQGVSS